jgi:hypothetical protein
LIERHSAQVGLDVSVYSPAAGWQQSEKQQLGLHIELILDMRRWKILYHQIWLKKNLGKTLTFTLEVVFAPYFDSRNILDPLLNNAETSEDEN